MMSAGLEFFVLLGLLFLVFVYTTIRTMRQPTPGGGASAETRAQQPAAQERDAAAAKAAEVAERAKARLGHAWERRHEGAPITAAGNANNKLSRGDVPGTQWGRELPRPVRGALHTPQPPASGHADRARQMLRTRQGLRDAVVMMAVLGPCRAKVPHDSSETAG
jgi:hypothetical protein